MDSMISDSHAIDLRLVYLVLDKIELFYSNYLTWDLEFSFAKFIFTKFLKTSLLIEKFHNTDKRHEYQFIVNKLDLSKSLIYL